jgi:hypothetical protein
MKSITFSCFAEDDQCHIMSDSVCSLETSCVDFISSTHGEQRRRERNIDKKDLQAAIKYGTKERSLCKNGHRAGEVRWKYTFAEVVYITDETSTIEVTSWTFPLPLEKAPLDSRMKKQISEQRKRLAKEKAPITSHTILVVDQSASMNSADVPGHRSRSRGVYYNIANEIIAAPLLANQTSYTDVITLIEMRDSAFVNPTICRAPIDWETYNNFVDLADDELRGKSHGNYVPALELVDDILCDSSDDNCALLVFFLSDGKPSDTCTNRSFYQGKNAKEFYENAMMTYIDSICNKFGSRLTFGFFGFASESSDFTVLQDMSRFAKVSGAKVSFFAEGVQCGALRGLLSTLVTSLTDTRSLLSSIVPTKSSSTFLRRPDLIKEISTASDTIFIRDEWNFYGQRENIQRVKIFMQRGKKVFTEIPLISGAAKGLAIKKKFFGEGSERIVHKMTEVDKDNRPVGELLVLKINTFVEENGKNQLIFHEIFGETQREASRFATKFNERLEFLKVPKEVPRIKFLDCTYYTAMINGWEHSFLVEKRLEIMKFKKWSDNKGGVHNLPKRDDEILDTILKFEGLGLDRIDEEDEDEDGSVDSGGKEEDNIVSSARKDLMDSILDDDVPHAFSHYTYVYSKHVRLVCDIQGVLHHNPPLFELTDPAIHSKDKVRFGKTDFGRKGMTDFFKTHECNPLCHVLFPKAYRKA